MTATLPPQLTITPRGAFEVSLRLPGSKSLTNRALLLAALAEGQSTIRNLLVADDIEVMLSGLGSLGTVVALSDDGTTATVRGFGGPFPPYTSPIPRHLVLGNAGTAVRPLTAALCLGTGVYELDGVRRMRERPIAELVEPLRQLGAAIEYLGRDGYPPLRIRANGLEGGRVVMGTTLSSQFITALLMAGPYMCRGLELHFDGPITSRPYVEMTLRLMECFGAKTECGPDWSSITVPPGRYRATAYTVEPDASNATYFLAAAATIPGSSCTVEALGGDSLQGDVAFVDVLAAMGATVEKHADRITISSPAASRLHGVDVNCNAIPDAAMTLATIAVYADGPTTIRDVGNWRVKETDRMEAMRVELTKLGARVTVDGDDITIEPPPGNRLKRAAIDTYDDHRMAMSFSILGLHPESPGITINAPGCVAKTFPDFFEYLDRLRP